MFSHQSEKLSHLFETYIMKYIVYNKNLYALLFACLLLAGVCSRSVSVDYKHVDENVGDDTDDTSHTFHDSVNIHHPPIVIGSRKHATSSHVIVNTEHPDATRISSATPALYFSLNNGETRDALRDSHIDSASLKLYVNRHPRCTEISDCHVTLNIYRVDANTTYQAKQLVKSQRISLDKNRLVSFDIMDTVIYWITHPSDNRGLLVQSDSSSDVYSLFNIPETNPKVRLNSKKKESFTNYKPVLQLGLRQRHKRNLEIHDCGSTSIEKRCCRHPIWVKFSDIGWNDWVVAPDGYQGYYCGGSCPYNYKVATNFASIQWMLRDLNENNVPQTHCSPTQHGHVKILYYDDSGRLVEKNKSNMVVERCGCL